VSLTPEDRLQIQLVEYQKAQDSAEHHDALLWTVVGILTSGIAALFGFGLEYYDGKHPKWMFIFLASLGMLLSALITFFVRSFSTIRQQKYGRCREIEESLGMKQHRELRCWGPQRFVVYMVSGIFFIVWLILLYTHLCSRPS
jgi:hypothetical protein